MPDYKRAFEIIKNKLEIGTYYNEYYPTGKYMYYLEAYSDEEITKEEYDLINSCLNAKPDSMDKIKADFKKLGFSFVEENSWNVIFINDFTHCKLYIDKEDKQIIYKENNPIISIELLQLINRIYKLWGVEVCH